MPKNEKKVGNSRWARPQLPKTGNKTREEIWTAVGAALTAWGEYESELGRLFSIFMAGDFPSPQAQRAFGAIRTFEGRSQMLWEAYEAFLAYHGRHIKEPKEFDELWNEATKAVKLRNDVAHGIVLPLSTQGAPVTNGYCLMPPYHDAKRDINDVPKFAYTAEMIGEFTTGFHNLIEAPRKFGNSIIEKIRAHRGRIPPRWNF
jgi:hypothetical protein